MLDSFMVASSDAEVQQSVILQLLLPKVVSSPLLMLSRFSHSSSASDQMMKTVNEIIASTSFDMRHSCDNSFTDMYFSATSSFKMNETLKGVQILESGILERYSKRRLPAELISNMDNDANKSSIVSRDIISKGLSISADGLLGLFVSTVDDPVVSNYNSLRHIATNSLNQMCRILIIIFRHNCFY